MWAACPHPASVPKGAPAPRHGTGAHQPAPRPTLSLPSALTTSPRTACCPVSRHPSDRSPSEVLDALRPPPWTPGTSHTGACPQPPSSCQALLLFASCRPGVWAQQTAGWGTGRWHLGTGQSGQRGPASRGLRTASPPEPLGLA